MSTEAFIPADYKAPTSGGGFTSLEAGDTVIRILSNPFMMWTSWTDKTPSRIQFKIDPVTGKNNKPAKGAGEKDSVKHSWGLIIWNYKTESIEVFELDKQGLIASLTSYAQNPKWGHPKHYDVVINKSGSGTDTKYSLVVEPKTPPTQDIIDAFLANPVDLTQLLVAGGNPFISVEAAPPAAPNPNQAALDAQRAAQAAQAAQAAASTGPAPTGDPIIDGYVAGQPVPTGYKLNATGGLESIMPF